MELPEKNPSSCIIDSPSNSMKNAPRTHWTSSSTCLYKILAGENGKRFKCFLIKYQGIKGQCSWSPFETIPSHVCIEFLLIMH